MTLKPLLKEPILHFLLIGLLLFWVYSRLAPAGASNEIIVVTTPMISAIAREYQARWQRPPTEQELAALVQAWVREEILYREGVAQGLDRDDAVIKRRVRQKLEVIAEEQLARDAATDADLQAFLDRHAERFRLPGKVSFEQIYFAAEAPAVQLQAAQQAAQRGSDPSRLGQPTMLPRTASDLPLDRVARDFGADFAAQLGTLPLGEWAGPVPSAFGQHLVRITERSAASMPPLDEVRGAVAREWENERRVASLAASYQALRSRYQVVIEAAAQ